MKFLLTLLLSVALTQSFAQQKLFRNITTDQIEKYQNLAGEYWNKGDSVTAISCLRDSIRHLIINSIIDDYEFETIKGNIYETRKEKKPIFLLVSASWCSPCKALIAPLNKIVEEYSDKVQFIVLFWDTKEELEDLPAKYSDKILLVPSPVKSSRDGMMPLNIAGFKHSIGYPTQYLIKDRKIVDYFTGATITEINLLNLEGKLEKKIATPEDEVFKSNYKLLNDNVKKIL